MLFNWHLFQKSPTRPGQPAKVNAPYKLEATVMMHQPDSTLTDKDETGPLVTVAGQPVEGERADLPAVHREAFKALTTCCNPWEFGRLWLLAKAYDSGVRVRDC